MAERRKLQKVIRGYKRVREFVPYAETQIREMVADGRFPKPIRFGPRALGWFEDDIIEYQERLRREQQA